MPKPEVIEIKPEPTRLAKTGMVFCGKPVWIEVGPLWDDDITKRLELFDEHMKRAVFLPPEFSVPRE